MTDRTAGFLVVLEESIRGDEGADEIAKALSMIQGVESVSSITHDPSTTIGEQRATFRAIAMLRELIVQLTRIEP